MYTFNVRVWVLGHGMYKCFVGVYRLVSTPTASAGHPYTTPTPKPKPKPPKLLHTPTPTLYTYIHTYTLYTQTGGRLPGAINVPSEEWGDDERIDALVEELKARALWFWIRMYFCLSLRVEGGLEPISTWNAIKPQHH